MSLSGLEPQECDAILESLKAAACGPFFPDWEFHSIFGVERSQIQAIVDSWPPGDERDETVFLAITNSIGNLLGYPHGLESEWPKWVSVTPGDLQRIREKWLASRRRSEIEDVSRSEGAA